MEFSHYGDTLWFECRHCSGKSPENSCSGLQTPGLSNHALATWWSSCLTSNIAVYQDYNITAKNDCEVYFHYVYSTAEHPRLKPAQHDPTPRRGTSYDKRCAWRLVASNDVIAPPPGMSVSLWKIRLIMTCDVSVEFLSQPLKGSESGKWAKILSVYFLSIYT